MANLITEDQIKSFTDISQNVDVSKFCHYIPIAERKKIKNAIGTACYNDLLDGVANDNLTPDETILLNGNGLEYEGIIKAVAWWVLYYAYPSFHSIITQTGLQTKRGETFDTVSSDILELRINQAKVQAEFYLDQVICFIKDNSELYPCYDFDCCDTPEQSGYGTSGIVLDNSLANRDPARRCRYCNGFSNTCGCTI